MGKQFKDGEGMSCNSNSMIDNNWLCFLSEVTLDTAGLSPHVPGWGNWGSSQDSIRKAVMACYDNNLFYCTNLLLFQTTKYNYKKCYCFAKTA